MKIVEQFIDILKRDDIKQEIRKISTNIISIVLYEINPYIYIIIMFGLLLFILNLAILILLLRINIFYLK
jgi:hypothetical protein